MTTIGSDHRALPPVENVEFCADAIRVANDLYLCGSEGENPEYKATGGKRSISDDGRRKLRATTALAPGLSWRVLWSQRRGDRTANPTGRDLFAQSGKARYIPHDDAVAIPPLRLRSTPFRAFQA